MQLQTVPLRTLNLAASQAAQVEAVVQLRQVEEQEVQLTLPLSNMPVTQAQFWLISLLVESTQEAQVPVGELQVWHW